jgi:hypothetical protein
MAKDVFQLTYDTSTKPLSLVVSSFRCYKIDALKEQMNLAARLASKAHAANSNYAFLYVLVSPMCHNRKPRDPALVKAWGTLSKIGMAPEVVFLLNHSVTLWHWSKAKYFFWPQPECEKKVIRKNHCVLFDHAIAFWDFISSNETLLMIARCCEHPQGRFKDAFRQGLRIDVHQVMGAGNVIGIICVTLGKKLTLNKQALKEEWGKAMDLNAYLKDSISSLCLVVLIEKDWEDVFVLASTMCALNVKENLDPKIREIVPSSIPYCIDMYLGGGFHLNPTVTLKQALLMTSGPTVTTTEVQKPTEVSGSPRRSYQDVHGLNKGTPQLPQVWHGEVQTPARCQIEQEVKEANEMAAKLKRQLKDALPRKRSPGARANDHECAAVNETLQDVKEQAEEPVSAPKAEATGEQDAFAVGTFGAVVNPGGIRRSSGYTSQPCPPRAILSTPLKEQFKELGMRVQHQCERNLKAGIAASLSSVAVGPSNDSSSSSDPPLPGCDLHHWLQNESNESSRAEAGSTVGGQTSVAL